MATSSRVRPERRGYAKINYEQHRDRVKTVTSTVDCGPPHPHPFSNKREQDKVFIIIYIIFKLINL
jgi:hypothetical protein